MGKGVALKIVNRYPSVKEVDQNTIQGAIQKLGGLTYVKVYDGFYVFNLYTQYHYSNYNKVIDYDALERALRRMIDKVLQLIKEGPVNIGMPYIGANNAGGTREEFLSVLEAVKEKYKGTRVVTLYVVNYCPK